jgi:hypothetical protein
MVTGHPASWVGKSYKSNKTGNIFKVLKVEKNRSRYSVKFDSENDWFRYLGLDSRFVRNNFDTLNNERE